MKQHTPVLKSKTIIEITSVILRKNIIMSMRENGKEVLQTLLKNEKNIQILEKNIYLASQQDEQKYNEILYEIVGDLLSKTPLRDILSNIKSKKILWKNNIFTDAIFRENEQNEFIKNPFEVEEGVFQCKACGSKRVYSYSRQDRSCDEGMSVYAQCVSCMTKWRERG